MSNKRLNRYLIKYRSQYKTVLLPLNEKAWAKRECIIRLHYKDKTEPYKYCIKVLEPGILIAILPKRAGKYLLQNKLQEISPLIKGARLYKNIFIFKFYEEHLSELINYFRIYKKKVIFPGHINKILQGKKRYRALNLL